MRSPERLVGVVVYLLDVEVGVHQGRPPIVHSNPLRGRLVFIFVVDNKQEVSRDEERELGLE